MSKFSKIVIFILIILLSVCTFSLATDINMNITEENNTSNSNISTYSNNISSSNNYNNTVNRNTSSNTNNSYNSTVDAFNHNGNESELSGTQVSSISRNDIDDGLGLSNILNILLIVVGVVLILLSIAILIRLHG